MKKRIISLILALALCVGMLPAPAWAEEAPGAQTLEKEVVSQNEEPQPEPAPQNEEGQEPQPISQNQEGQEPPQGEPQEEPQGEPQEEPEQEEPPVQSVLKANAPMAVAEGENGEEVTLTVGEQNGKLFDGVNSAATFPVTCENGNLNSLKITFSPENSDLTAAVSEDGTTVTVMTAGNAKAGIYQMTLALGQTSQTVPVIVDVPFTIKNREIQVASDQTSATLTLEVDVAPELEGQVQYTWTPDGKNSVVTNTNTVTLHPDNLKQDETSPGRYSAWVDCRVSCGTYFGTATRKFVKIIACDHSGAILYTKEGTCRGCGQLCPEDSPFITEDGVAIQIAQNANTPFALDDYFPGTLYLWEDYTRGTDLDVGTLDGNGTLELQNHNVYSKLILDDFQGHSFKIYDGYLTQLTLNQAGSLILENVTIENPLTVPAGTDLEIKKNVEFKNRVSFNGPAKLTGGTFNAGLSHQDEQDEPHSCLELLAPGYAFADGNKEIIDASRESISGKVQVVSHPTCTYKADKAGKCDCGRSCPHESLNEQGYCTVCKMLVEPFAIGEQGYRSLEEAQTAAQEGQTIYLRGDYKLPNPVVISKNITLDVCGYTLSGSSENALLQITGTDVTVQKGDIWNTQAPAVTVKSGANLTVKTASFGGGPDHVLVVEQGGRADVHNGGFLHGVLYVDGSLSMKNGLQVNLKLGPNVGKISIVEGNFDSITLAGGKEYKDLLAEGSAYWADGAWVKLVEAQEKTPVVIAECPHQDGLAGSQACPYCGKTCGHGNMDQETGFCKDCGYQVCKAKVDDEMMSTFQEAMDAAQAGKTVTLLADDSLGGNLTLDKKITLNINGYTLQTSTFTVLAPLTICGGGEIENEFSFNAPVTVQGTRLKAHKGVVEKGGSLCIEQGATVNLVSVFPGGSLELKQGTVGILYVADGGKARLSSGTVTQKLEMEKGNILSILPQGKALEKDGKIVNGNESNVVGPVTVVDHTHMFDGSTTCPCGYTAAATLDTEAGKQYFADFSVALEEAKAASGSTLTLFQDVALTGESNLYIDSGTFTIDWHGHTLSGEMSNALLCITDAANVTLTDSVGTGGVRNVRGAAIGAYVGSPGSLTIQGGVYSPQLWKDRTAYGPIRISGGRFENPEDSGRNGALYCYTGALAELLAPGYTFAYEDDDSLVDVYSQRKSDIYRTVYVVEHQHEFDEGQCPCGYKCPHAEVDEAGDCTLCGKPLYVQGTYADGTTHYYGALSDALEDPAVTQAVMIGSSGPACESWDGGDRSVTLDLSFFGATIKSVRSGHLILRDSTDTGSILYMTEILKDGQVTVESGTVFPQGETLSVSGKLTVTGGDVGSLTAMEGSTVSISGGDVNSLTAMEGSTVSLTGGSFGEIVGSGVTLRSLLAEDCYYAELGGETPKDYADTDTVLERVSVKLCDHTSVRENKGTYFTTYTCNCGKVRYLLTVTVGESDKKYFGDYNTGFAYAAKSDGVVRFLELNGTIEVNAQGMVTIDMENRSYSAYDRSLVIKSGSTVKLVGQGAVMSKPEAGGGSGGSGTLEYGEFIPVTVEAGGTFVLPANNLNGEPNMAKPTQLTVQSGGTAELQGGSTQRTDVYGTLKISGGSHLYIHQYEKGQLNITGGQIQLLQIYGDLPQNALSGGSYVTISVMEFRFGETEKFRDVTFADFQKMLVSGKVFQKKQDQSYPNEAEKAPNYGTFNYKKELNKVNVTAAPFTGVQAICQLGNTVHSGSVNTTYGAQEENFFLKARLLSPAAEDQSVTYQWYQVQDGSKTEVGKDATYTLNRSMNVGVYTYQVTASCNGYELTSDPFTVTVGKAPQTAEVEAYDETVSGKNDGYVTLKPQISAYEMRKPGEAFTACEVAGTKLPLPAGTYEIRMKETENYEASGIQTVTVRPGPKLTLTLPENQKGYTLTASKTQLGWHEDVTLSFQLDSVGAYKAADFGIWAEAGSGEKTKLTLGNDGAVKLTAPEKDITITVTGVKTDNVAPQASIRGRLRKDSGYYVKWEGFQENPADDFVNGDFVISATDRVSGVADFWYYLSDKPLTLEELKGMNGAFWARPANQGKVSITEDGEYYLYAKALDKANNVGYACTGKLVKESNLPTFSGVKDGETYYVSQQMEIHDDGMPDWYMANGSIGEVPNGGNENPIKLRLPNNGSSYTFTVGDRCGNEATITVYMKPLSDLTQPLDSILEDTIRKSDRATLDDVEATLKGLDVTYATEPEKKEMNDALARIAQLRQVLDQVAAVEAQIAALPDSVEPYQQTVEDTQIKPARKAYSDLTDHQKTLVDSAKLDKLVRLEAQLNAWTITEGDGQTWYKGSGKSLSFTVNGQSRKFIGVRLENDKTLGKAMLTVSDSMDAPFTIALKPEYLQCQEPGEHSFAVIYRGGTTGDVTFTVKIPANYLDVTNKPEFDGKTTVTIDGKEYPIEEMGGERYVNLPETGDLLTIYSFKDGTPTGSHTNYPTGMQVFRITRQEGGAKAEEITEFANLLNYAGCSIRISGKQGIRMITGIDQDVKKSLVSKAGLAGYTLEEYGTVVQWADALGSNTLNLNSSNKQNYAYKKGKADPIFSRANGMIQYTNVLVGFSLEDCAKDLVLRPYIKLKDMTTGETVTLYGGSVCRSIGYVAKQNENTYKPGTAGYKYVHKIIDAVYGKTEQGG
mgnify:CR=1 FL=1